MNTSDMPGAVEVVVICRDGVQLNGPDHRTVGWVETGQHAITHESYLPHLREHGIACLPGELNLMSQSAEAELEDLRIALQSAEGDESLDSQFGLPNEDETTPEVVEEVVEAPPAPKAKGGRPKARP